MAYRLSERRLLGSPLSVRARSSRTTWQASSVTQLQSRLSSSARRTDLASSITASTSAIFASTSARQRPSSPIASLRPHPQNPRRGDLEAVKESLRHHGQYRPVVANLVDNRTSDLAGYDDALLVELLSELGELSGTGFDEAALDDLLEEVAPPPDEDEELPPAPREPESRPGDLYALGDADSRLSQKLSARC